MGSDGGRSRPSEHKEHFNDYDFKSVNSANPLTLLFFLFNPYSFIVLKKVLKDYKPDIVHLHTMHQLTPSVLFLLRKYPVVMTLHGPESFIKKLLFLCMKPPYLNYFYDKQKFNAMGRLSIYFNHVQRMIYKLVLRNVDVFIAPSKFIQNAAKIDVSPIIHLPNFIEAGTLYEIKNEYKLLFVGRLEKVKGIEYLIKAMFLLIKVFPQTTLTVVGDGSHKKYLVNLTEDLHLNEHIQFIGWVENNNLDAYYEKASAVIIPSIGPENFPTVCNEAMSRGRPVIGTKVGGMVEIIDDGVNGYLIEPQCPEQIAEKVIKLFSEEKLLKELGRNAWEKAKKFSIEKYVESVEVIYEEVKGKYKGL
jgi:glycosyltransferase involved in cell wall biosynthesis